MHHIRQVLLLWLVASVAQSGRFAQSEESRDVKAASKPIVLRPDEALLADLEKRLVEVIPKRVKALAVKEPVYCLRIWYYGTDVAGDRSPTLTLKANSLRKTILKEKGESAPHYLWCADEYERGQGVHNAQLEDPEIMRICREWFKQLPKGGLPNDDYLIPLRKAVQRAALRLNQADWRPFISRTDDFVVFAADGSHSFAGDFEEMQASVPASRIDDFRSRSLIGPIKWYTLSRDAKP